MERTKQLSQLVRKRGVRECPPGRNFLTGHQSGFVLRSLPTGEAVVPDPLYVEITDGTRNRLVRLQGWIRKDGEPHFYDIRTVAVDQRQYEGPAEPDLVSPVDLQRWKAKVILGAIKHVAGRGCDSRDAVWAVPRSSMNWTDGLLMKRCANYEARRGRPGQARQALGNEETGPQAKPSGRCGPEGSRQPVRGEHLDGGSMGERTGRSYPEPSGVG